MTRIVYLNGAFLPEHEAHISIFDRGFLFGDGIYEVTAVSRWQADRQRPAYGASGT